MALEFTKLRNDLQGALKAWRKMGGTSEDLLDYLLLVRERREVPGRDNSAALLRLSTNEVLLEAIEQLAQQDEQAAQILRWRFPNGEGQAALVSRLNVSRDTVSRLQRAAINQLAKTLLELEAAAREGYAQTMEAELEPSTYKKLFGVEEARSQLLEQLLQMDGAAIIAVSGLGGIGKTALADSVTRQVIREFVYDKVFWIRIDRPQTMSGRSESPQLTLQSLLADLSQRLWPGAADGLPPQQRLARVRQALKARPHLVVIDNLESEGDTAYLLEHMNDLAQPGKFLLTSRTRLSLMTNVFDLSLDELSLADATSLVRSYAREKGNERVAAADQRDIDAIYKVIGGNPLFLKLVTDLLRDMPLPDLLVALERGRHAAVEERYLYIYWPTWQSLSTQAQVLLRTMAATAGSGAKPALLQRMSKLEDGQFYPALQELRGRSLVEVRGSLSDVRYGIHQLTRAFVNTEIIKLPAADSI